jgi:hypothetical protein
MPKRALLPDLGQVKQALDEFLDELLGRTGDLA